MVKVPATALQPFRLADRQVAVGESVDLEPIDAVVMHRKGLVSLSRQITSDKALQPEEPVETPRSKRRYRRRDLVADPE